MGFGIFSRGSLAGFSSSFKISVRVISPMPSSSAIFFLSLTRFSSPPAACMGVSFVLSGVSGAMPPIAAASAFPIAVLVFLMTICCFLFVLFLLVLFLLLSGFADAAFFWISFKSSIEIFNFSRSLSAAS